MAKQNNHLFDRFGDLVEADVEVELLLLEVGALLVVEFDKVVDEVEEVARRDGCAVAAAAR